MSERLLLDQDGVLADTMGRVMDLVEEEHGISLCHGDIKDYWFAGLPIDPKHVIEILRRPGFYRSLDVMTGAVRAVNRLRQEYDVVVVTAPMNGAEGCENEKRDWLEEHFDTEFAKNAIVTPNKFLVCGKVLIEDNPDIDASLANWTPLMFDQPWNQEVSYPRMYGWGDVETVRAVMK